MTPCLERINRNIQLIKVPCPPFTRPARPLDRLEPVHMFTRVPSSFAARLWSRKLRRVQGSNLLSHAVGESLSKVNAGQESRGCDTMWGMLPADLNAENQQLQRERASVDVQSDGSGSQLQHEWYQGESQSDTKSCSRCEWKSQAEGFPFPAKSEKTTVNSQFDSSN